MNLYTYTVTPVAETLAHVIKLYQDRTGSEVIANVRFCPGAHPGNWILDPFDVRKAYQGRGLSYALIYLGLVHVKERGAHTATVTGAHGLIFTPLLATDFLASQQSIQEKKGIEIRYAQFDLANIRNGITKSRLKLLAHRAGRISLIPKPGA